MLYEIIVALKKEYADDEEYLVDCLLDLKDHYPYSAKLIKDELRAMGRCEWCGEKLESVEVENRHGEYHETHFELVCPACEK